MRSRSKSALRAAPQLGRVIDLDEVKASCYVVRASLLPEASRLSDAECRLRELIWRHRPDLVFRTGLRILFTENTSRLVSLSYRGSVGTLRAHFLFATAPAEVLEAIVLYFFTHATSDRARALRARIIDFVARRRDFALATMAVPRLRPPKGRIHDLEKIRNAVIEEHVPERRGQPERLRMGWSTRATPSLMGKWLETPPRKPNLIVVNRLLDCEEVPGLYVEYVVFHEILHDIIPVRRHAGRWLQHPAEFRRREAEHPQYEEARAWEAEHLGRLTGALRRRAREA